MKTLNEKQFRKYQHRTQVGFFLVGLVATVVIKNVDANGFDYMDPEVQGVITQVNEPESGSMDLSSLKTSTVERTTVLGNKVLEKNKSFANREYEILKDDPAMAQKWDVRDTDTDKAWTRLRAVGSKDVKVCIIDTGIDEDHPDLKANLWVNSGETGKDRAGIDKRTNGVDDDKNGFVDDVHGYNFVGNNSDLKDNHGHGTHIAGIIGAVGGNKIGITGISPNVSLVIAKYFDPQSSMNNNLYNTVRAIHYCIDQGVDMINYSGGGTSPSDKELAAVKRARDNKILFVAAAGNEHSNSDLKKYYPADYELDNIISVTAVDKEQNVLPSSNFGEKTVHIAAPGKNIYSTLPGGSYGLLTGTSQATGVVTGVAALIKARYRDFDGARVIRHITETGDWDPIKLRGKTAFQKRLNTYRALAILDNGTAVNGAVPKNVSAIDNSKIEPSRNVATDQTLSGFSGELKKFLQNQK
jgi:thermitase